MFNQYGMQKEVNDTQKKVDELIQKFAEEITKLPRSKYGAFKASQIINIVKATLDLNVEIINKQIEDSINKENIDPNQNCNSETSTETYNAIVGDEISEQYKNFMGKREWLQEKWKNMDDSEEKRRISDLIFVDPKKLAVRKLAILSDNLEIYKKMLSTNGGRWVKDLEGACLCGSRKIGEFIIKENEKTLSNSAWGMILGHISISGNNDWAIDCAKKIKNENQFINLNSYFEDFCVYCEDFDLIDKISEIFEIKENETKFKI